ncbi:hypothetical protein ASNO1_73480 [Corallococcus caeni]|uniref:Secreted protein n=1 Tax=Corallococcus caeni TaxID=3082388 RepID=A0ABQ6R443_9BACT|nr:hypothetical protein ASNO1_73480 [Corallococcus sp. NO1]
MLPFIASTSARPSASSSTAFFGQLQAGSMLTLLGRTCGVTDTPLARACRINVRPVAPVAPATKR